MIRRRIGRDRKKLSLREWLDSPERNQEAMRRARLDMCRIQTKNGKWIVRVDGKLLALTDGEFLELAAECEREVIEVIGEPP